MLNEKGEILLKNDVIADTLSNFFGSIVDLLTFSNGQIYLGIQQPFVCSRQNRSSYPEI